MKPNWKGKRVLIIGVARQGLALARYLSKQGAKVTLNDKQPAGDFSSISPEMESIGVDCVFGGHPLELLESADLLSISGGIPLDLPLITAAKNKNITLTNDSQIFMQSVAGRVIGITGSAGKTTTTTLLGIMATEEMKPPRKAWIGGNIGLPLVEYLDVIKVDDDVILELSSFQLELMRISPRICAVLNITPNHLDRHGTLKEYTAAKSNILKFQGRDDIAVINREDPGAWELRGMVKGQLVTFGTKKPGSGIGSFIGDQIIKIFDNGKEISLFSQDQVLLRGNHNLMNVLAACAIAYSAGYHMESILKGIKDFSGVSHRLEYVRDWQGSSWYNDSIATAPERTIAAIHSFSEPLIVLLGGRDKNLPWQKLVHLIRERVDHVVLFGEAREKIYASLEPVQTGKRPYTIMQCQKMKDAILAASEIAEPGDVVLFSPGGTSFDEFRDFEERGERYREWVNQL